MATPCVICGSNNFKGINSKYCSEPCRRIGLKKIFSVLGIADSIYIKNVSQNEKVSDEEKKRLLSSSTESVEKDRKKHSLSPIYVDEFIPLPVNRLSTYSDRLCKGCGKEFKCIIGNNIHYCSEGCRKKSVVIKNCLNCNRSYPKIHRISFCSTKCKEEYNIGLVLLGTCKECGETILKRRSNAKRNICFCSINCHTFYEIKKREENWSNSTKHGYETISFFLQDLDHRLDNKCLYSYRLLF